MQINCDPLAVVIARRSLEQLSSLLNCRAGSKLVNGAVLVHENTGVRSQNGRHMVSMLPWLSF
jgi:hypothetical protein